MLLVFFVIYCSLLLLVSGIKERFTVGVPDWSTFNYRAGSGVNHLLWSMGYVIIHGVPAPVPAYVRK